MIWNQYYNGYTSTSGSWYTEDIASNTVPSQGSKQSSGLSFTPETMETTQNHIQKFYRLGWQTSALCLTYLIALEQIKLIEDKDLVNQYTASINTLIDKVFTNQISKDSLEKKIKNAKDTSDKVEYRILLDIAKNIK